MQGLKKHSLLIICLAVLVVAGVLLWPRPEQSPVPVKQTVIPLSQEDISSDSQLQQALRHQSEIGGQKPQVNPLQPTAGP